MTGTREPQPSFSVEIAGDGSIRLVASPQDWARWMDYLTPVAFKSLVLLTGPVPNHTPSAEDWPVLVLVERGLAKTEAVAGVEELRDKGYLPPEPFRSHDYMRAVPSTPAVRARQPLPKCSVCGGMRSHDSDGLITYAVQRGEYIKIGVTRNLHQRLTALSKVVPGVTVPEGFDPRCELVLLGTTGQAEHDVHERFAGHHVAGEWFRDSPAIRRALRELAGIA